MIDDDLKLFSSDPNKACRAYSDPLFLQDHFLFDGHHDKTPNATATFVRYRGRVYACTCRHVSEALTEPGLVKGDHPTAALMFGKAVLNLSMFTAEGLRSVLRSPTGDIEHHTDVAIAGLGHTWDLLCERKPKVAIDLDQWEPPPWGEVQFCHAAGYADEHKSMQDDNVTAPMPLVTAEVTSKLSDDCREFTLSSSLTEPHGMYFSGLSGGPVLAAWGDRFTPIGLVFEGYPSKPGVASFWAGPNDILIRGVILTPTRFAAWLTNMS